MKPTEGLMFVPFILIFIGMFLWFGLLIFRKVLVLKKAAPADRFDRKGKRIGRLLSFFVGQKRLFDRQFRTVGVMHALIFWGFLVLIINSSNLIMEGFHLPFLSGTSVVVQSYLWLKDITEIVVLLMVAIALFRRIILRPKRTTLSGDANFVLFMIGLLMVTDLIQAAASASPSLAGTYFNGLTGTNPLIFNICWWVHYIALLSFLVYLPYSKHFHVVTAMFNVYFSSLDKALLQPIDIETAETFGVSKIEDFSWKDLLDVHTCTECGRCQENCPAALTDKTLSPKMLNESMKHHLAAKENAICKGQEWEGKSLIGDIISEETIWDCTTCRACEESCPLFVEFVGRIVEMRRHLVLEESRFDGLLQTTFTNLENQGNPWGISVEDRLAWADGLELSTMAENSDVEYLYWVGCAGAYDEESKKVAIANAELLKKAGVSFAVLGKEERCTGDLARRAGNEYLFSMMAEMNIETMKSYGIKKIIANCPHCFNTLKDEYPQYGGNFEVIHTSEFMLELIREGKLKPDKEISSEITYHDPCYLGRHNGLYDAPREILNLIPGIKLKEMERSKNKALCCGAGGARMWLEETSGSRINHERVNDAVHSGAECIASSCPFCLTMLTDGIKETEQSNKLTATDIAVLLNQSVK